MRPPGEHSFKSGVPKKCSRCQQEFRCHAEDVTLCFCAAIPLNDAQRLKAMSSWSDCLCSGCLELLASDPNF
jgi:hypothetical protein